MFKVNESYEIRYVPDLDDGGSHGYYVKTPDGKYEDLRELRIITVSTLESNPQWLIDLTKARQVFVTPKLTFFGFRFVRLLVLESEDSTEPENKRGRGKLEMRDKHEE